MQVAQFGSVAQQGAPQPTAAQYDAHYGSPRGRTGPHGSLPPTVSSALTPVHPTVGRDTLPPLVRYSRWKKSTGTFGPAGRLVATFLVLLPMPVFIATVATGIGIIGAGIYLIVVLPWALRDIWKKAAVKLDTPAPAPTGPRF
jgi:hypothetical protein